MADEFRVDNTLADVKPRPVWMQVTIGLLMGAVALLALTVLLGRLA